MSMWTYITGTVTVECLGSMSQADEQYQVYKTLEHLPRITGSEGNIKPYVIKKHGNRTSSNVDEYDAHSNLTNGIYFDIFEVQPEYIIVLDGSLRDRTFTETLKETMRWLCRLAKRIEVQDVLLRISDSFGKEMILNRDDRCFSDMFETPYDGNGRRWEKNYDFWFYNMRTNSAIERWREEDGND